MKEKKMTRITGPVATTFLGVLPAQVRAQPGWENGYGHMWGGAFGLFGALMMLLFWGAIIVAVVLAVRWMMQRNKESPRHDALEILQERFARGEIDQEEYEARRKVLES